MKPVYRYDADDKKEGMTLWELHEIIHELQDMGEDLNALYAVTLNNFRGRIRQITFKEK